MSDINDEEYVTQPPPVPQAPINPLLSRGRLPGETFRLPSRGVFYNNNELDDSVIDGEVHIHSMTAIDEINIASPSKLFSGEGVAEVIQRCIPSIKKPMDLLAQDVDFIMMCLRKVSYGPNFEFRREHTECTVKVQDDDGVDLPPSMHRYDINIEKLIKQTKEIDATTVNTLYRIELDNNQVIRMQPIRFRAYVVIMQAITQTSEESELTETDQANMLLDQISGMINSVDEIDDPHMIREWLSVISPAQIKNISTSIADMAVWGPNTKTKVKCVDCKKKMEVDLPTNPLVLFS